MKKPTKKRMTHHPIDGHELETGLMHPNRGARRPARPEKRRSPSKAYARRVVGAFDVFSEAQKRPRYFVHGMNAVGGKNVANGRRPRNHGKGWYRVYVVAFRKNGSLHFATTRDLTRKQCAAVATTLNQVTP